MTLEETLKAPGRCIMIRSDDIWQRFFGEGRFTVWLVEVLPDETSRTLKIVHGETIAEALATLEEQVQYMELDTIQVQSPLALTSEG